MKTAIVIGGTGLVGNALVLQLLNSTHFGQVLVFGRRSLELVHEKLQEHIINFDKPQLWKHLVKGDVFFSCLGTTLRQAGSKDAQYRVDYQYQFSMASVAAENKVPAYILVSSVGADSNSRLFYTRMKGQLDEGVSRLPFIQTAIIRPGALYGSRKKFRPGETASVGLLKLLNAVGILRKYRPITGKQVANAMIQIALGEKRGVTIYENDQLFELAVK
ncbi:NAD-dependent epimerase/dehydratase family protein [Filimonas effusa]|uniref:NAD-dependent epimerase/dehydratase family protein n=1 Tax=Filimonas effusa TaxID=2508721 RepID=A0A4Q1D173_9BACT|nr:NAD-dependent epimerase/dehydratase family protein [Filimonas effusa]RXK80745.1 NAD-dependent epimerase/dehydratase family protein [Filimonas effusa]